MARHYFFHDDNTVTSYTTEELAQGGLLIGQGVLLYALLGFVSILITAVIVAPFVVLFLLDTFVETIVANNWIFFAILGIVLLCLKIFTKKASRNLLVRFLFNSYVVVAILYLFLYVLHFDSTVYSIVRVIAELKGGISEGDIFEIFQNDNFIALTDGNWYYELMFSVCNSFIDFVKWSFQNLIHIDASCFSVVITQINIFAVLKTIGLYIGLGALALVGTLLFGLIILIVVLLSVALPYIISILAVVAINKIIKKIKNKR